MIRMNRNILQLTIVWCHWEYMNNLSILTWFWDMIEGYFSDWRSMTADISTATCMNSNLSTKKCCYTPPPLRGYSQKKKMSVCAAPFPKPACFWPKSANNIFATYLKDVTNNLTPYLWPCIVGAFVDGIVNNEKVPCTKNMPSARLECKITYPFHLWTNQSSLNQYLFMTKMTENQTLWSHTYLYGHSPCPLECSLTFCRRYSQHFVSLV